MTAKTTPKTEAQIKRLNQDTVQNLVKKQIMTLLGKPKDLWRIDVNLLGHGRARVNVWRRENIKTENKGGLIGALGSSNELTETTHITDSFYIRLTETAAIETASPPIERRYQLAG